MAAKTDQKTLRLIEEVKKQKAEISAIEHPVWHTNMSFTYQEGDMNKAINLHTVSDLKTLIQIAGFICHQSASYTAAAVHLQIENAPEFTWQGFRVDDWLADIQLRISKIQIGVKKKKLEALETRLNAIISPELRAELELQAIEEALST